MEILGQPLLKFLPIFCYFSFLLYLTFHFRLKGKVSDRDYFLADRKIRPRSALISIIATETSVATVVLFPAVGLSSGLALLWLCLGFIMGRWLTARYYLPGIFNGRSISLYRNICHNNEVGHRVLAFAYLISKYISGGVRFFMGGYAINQLFAWNMEGWILLLALVVGGYSLSGGLRSVVVTDQLQGAIIFAMGALLLLYLLFNIPAGQLEIPALINTDFSYNNSLFFIALFLGGTVLSIGTHGADQDMLQRVLGLNDLKLAQRTLFYSALGATLVIFLFLSCGHLLLQSQVSGLNPKSPLVDFIARSDLPLLHGLLTLLLVAAAMSTLDSAIHSTGAVWKEMLNSKRSGQLFSLLSLVILALFALLFNRLTDESGNFLKLALGSMNYINGGLIAILTLHTFKPELISSAGVTCAIVGGFLATISCDLLLQPPLAWTYTIIVSSSSALLIGSLATLLQKSYLTRRYGS